MRVADNLIKCNTHYRGKFQLWEQRGVDARDIRCRIANRATRTVFQMVSGRRLYDHPSRLDRHYVLDKLLAFHREHGTPPCEILRDLERAAGQIPHSQQAAEAAPLRQACQRARRSRRPGPQAIGEILVVVLAKLGMGRVQSEAEAPSPDANASGTSTR
jgi:transposase